MPHRVLLEKVWGSDYGDATDYLKVYVQRLRVKLDDDPQDPKLILSERGVGYKLAKQTWSLTWVIPNPDEPEPKMISSQGSGIGDQGEEWLTPGRW